MEWVSPALAGGFLTTEPPRDIQMLSFRAGAVRRAKMWTHTSPLPSSSLPPVGVSSFCPQDFGENQGSWPLVLTLLRGTLMGAGFLLTCGLRWIYYTRWEALSRCPWIWGRGEGTPPVAFCLVLSRENPPWNWLQHIRWRNRHWPLISELCFPYRFRSRARRCE